MSQALSDLINLMVLEKIEDGIYRGQSEDLGLPQVFGGQVVGQALYAAQQTVCEERNVNSFHSYFLRRGDSQKPIVYAVENLRDGKSFSTRKVNAIQNGKPIFSMTASFQGDEESFSHQCSMPDVPQPEELVSDQEIAKQIATKLPEKAKRLLLREVPIEWRAIRYYSPFNCLKSDPVRYVWFKSNGSMPEIPAIHQYLLGYASDYHFLPTALQPHGYGFMQPEIQIATIDHSMWFHRPIHLDQWHLYAVESPSVSGARGFVRGQIFNREGLLVASTTQEGVLRIRQPQ